MGRSKAQPLAAAARSIAVSLLVALPETGAVVVLVRVFRPVRIAVPVIGVAVIAMTDRIVAVAVAAVALRRKRKLPVVSGAVTVGETDAEPVTLRGAPVERPAAARVRFTLPHAFAVTAIVGLGARRRRPDTALDASLLRSPALRRVACRRRHYCTRNGDRQQLSPSSYAHRRSPRWHRGKCKR